MDPLLLDIPDRLETERLMLRVPRAGDGAMVSASVRESLPELKPWMPWAKDDYGEADGEQWCRRNAGEFLTRKELSFLIFSRQGEHLGTCRAHEIGWDVPRLEIGYWLRTRHVGHGYMTEAVGALTKMIFEHCKARRVSIHTDELNERSWRVAERAGFELEGTLRNMIRESDGRLRTMRVYSKIAANDTP